MKTPLPLGDHDAVPIVLLREHPRNPRRITSAELERLKANLLADPAMLRARRLMALPDGRVIGGNQRLKAARDLGWKEVPVAVVDVSEERAYEWMVRDNDSFGEWDDPLLRALAADMPQEAVERLSPEMRERLAGDERRDEIRDVTMAPPAVPVTRLGDLVELGPHRLICGDATDPAVVTELLGGVVPAVMVTDPPYGVSVDHTWRDGLRQPIGAARTGTVANDDRFDWHDAYALYPGNVAYVWHAALYAGDVKTHLEACRFDVRQQLIWVKTVHALGRAAYQWRHEACWYAVRKGKAAGWRGGAQADDGDRGCVADHGVRRRPG